MGAGEAAVRWGVSVLGRSEIRLETETGSCRVGVPAPNPRRCGRILCVIGAANIAGNPESVASRHLEGAARPDRRVRRQCRGGLGIEILEFRNCNPSQSVSQSVISRSRPALTPPPARSPAPPLPGRTQVIIAPSKFHDVEIPSFLQKSWNREFEAQTRKLGIVILAFFVLPSSGFRNSRFQFRPPALNPALLANPGFRNSRFHFRPPALLAIAFCNLRFTG